MLCEHLIHATFNDSGSMRVLQTNHVERLLHEESLHELYKLGKYLTKPRDYINKFDTEQVVAYSHVEPIYDQQHGRKTTWNHTILIRYIDIIPYDKIFSDFLQKVKPHFIPPLNKSPERLEPLHIP